MTFLHLTWRLTELKITLLKYRHILKSEAFLVIKTACWGHYQLLCELYMIKKHSFLTKVNSTLFKLNLTYIEFLYFSPEHTLWILLKWHSRGESIRLW